MWYNYIAVIGANNHTLNFVHKFAENAGFCIVVLLRKENECVWVDSFIMALTDVNF